MAMGNECFVILRNGSVGEVIMREVYSSKSNDIKLQRIPNFGGNHSIAIVTNGQKLSCRRKEIKHSKGRIAQPKREAFTTHNPPLATKFLEIVHPTPSKMSTYENAPVQYITVNGIRFAYLAIGPLSPPTNGTHAPLPLVMNIHFRGTFDHWDPLLINALAAIRLVILIDNAGAGKSGGEVPEQYA